MLNIVFPFFSILKVRFPIYIHSSLVFIALPTNDMSSTTTMISASTHTTPDYVVSSGPATRETTPHVKQAASTSGVSSCPMGYYQGLYWYALVYCTLIIEVWTWKHWDWVNIPWHLSGYRDINSRTVAGVITDSVRLQHDNHKCVVINYDYNMTQWLSNYIGHLLWNEEV